MLVGAVLFILQMVFLSLSASLFGSRFFICGSVLSNLAQDFDDASPRLQGKVDLKTVLEDYLDFGMVTFLGADHLLYSSVFDLCM